MTDPTPEQGTRRTELRKRRQTRRGLAVIAVVVLLVVAVGGVFLATRATGSTEAAAAKAPTTALPQAAPGLSPAFGVAPMRAAPAKGGDSAVYAPPATPAMPPPFVVAARMGATPNA